MRQHTQIHDVQGRQEAVFWDDTAPDQCPICHTNVAPKRHGMFRVKVRSQHPELHVTYQCTNGECESVFIGIYQARPETVGTSVQPVFYLSHAVPVTPLKVNLSPEIIGVSEEFGEIYNQALASEAYGMTQLTGVGLRKALEFLIKDYVILKNPEKKEEIEHKFLGSCIKEFVDDPRVKACAERAVWLGNDETHYVRKWEHKDLNDLKILIKLTMNWIESDILTEKYIADMS